MILGITGGVGAGKSSVLAILEKEYNAKLILADEVGRELMQPGEANYVNIVNAFGKEILNEDQTIDTKKLAATAFSNPLETLRLNAITHPNVRVRIEWMIKEIRDKEPDALIVIEAALLSEGHLIPLCDDVWYIYTDEQIRIKRIMESRGYSKERCIQTIARQKSDAQFRAECRVVIDNSHSIEETHFETNAIPTYFLFYFGKYVGIFCTSLNVKRFSDRCRSSKIQPVHYDIHHQLQCLLRLVR